MEAGEIETTQILRGWVRVQYVIANPGHQVGSYVREGGLDRGLII